MNGASRLPIKTLYRGLEIGEQAEQLLNDAMARLDLDDYDQVLRIVLQAYLERAPRTTA